MKNLIKKISNNVFNIDIFRTDRKIIHLIDNQKNIKIKDNYVLLKNYSNKLKYFKNKFYFLVTGYYKHRS